MVIKVLIVDPDIAFAVPIKRALEQSGDYVVNVFANGKAALELIKHEPQDVAILDLLITDIDIFTLIGSLRALQPGLAVLTSTRSAEGVAQSQSLEAQGSIRKPYFARELGPMIREALAKRSPSEQNRETSSAFSTAIKPDDTFYRLVTTLYNGDTTGHMKPVEVPPDAAKPSIFDEPEIPEGATIRDLVSGQQSPAPSSEEPSTSSVVAPTNELEPEADAPDLVATAALDAVRDDTVPLNFLQLPNFVSRIEKELLNTPNRSIPPFTEQADQSDQTEPPISKEDYNHSQQVEAEPREMPGDTQADGGVVQEAIESFGDNTPIIVSEPVFYEQANQPETAPVMASVEPVSEPAADATETPIAALAVQLTQFTVDSAAHATVVTQGGTLIASAGQLPPPAIARIVEIILAAWQGAVESGGSLVRYIQVPDFGDYLLYSVPTLDDMVLSMVCPAEMPLGVIRKQAKNLIAALQHDVAHETESEAATTLPSRPTDLRPPEGLQAAISAQMTSAESTDAEEAGVAEPLPVEGPFSSYAFVWLPRQVALTPEETESLLDAINLVAKAHRWQVEGVDVQPQYVSVQVSIDASETSTATIEMLMHETAVRAEDDNLWADAYYIVTPGRPVTQQEIASFMEYRREAQNAA